MILKPERGGLQEVRNEVKFTAIFRKDQVRRIGAGLKPIGGDHAKRAPSKDKESQGAPFHRTGGNRHVEVSLGVEAGGKR